MKNILIILLAAMLFGSCKESSSYTLFGHKIRKEEGIKIHKSDDRFLKVCGLGSLYDVWIPALKTDNDVRKVIAPFIPADIPLGDITTVLLYTTHSDTTNWDIQLNETPAISIFRLYNNSYYHDYLERKGEKFEVVPQFSSAIAGGMTYDDIRLMHFASSKSTSLPKSTIIYQLRLNPRELPKLTGDPDLSIGNAMLMDMKRNNGMATVDMYGEDFYKVMMLDNTGGTDGHCGNIETCALGSNGCIMPPANELDKTHPCSEKAPGCCNHVMVAAKVQYASEKIPFDFRDMFDFRDKFIFRYELGRRYYAYFCLAGRYMRMDPAAIKNYIDAARVVNDVMKKLNGKDDSAVIFDEEFTSVFTTFVANHKGRGVKELEEAMTNMANDLARCKGFTKAQTMAMLDESNAARTASK